MVIKVENRYILQVVEQETHPFAIHVDILFYPHIIIVWIVVRDFEFTAFLVLSFVFSGAAGFIVMFMAFLAFAIWIFFMRPLMF